MCMHVHAEWHQQMGDVHAYIKGDHGQAMGAPLYKATSR